jgi:hypothetical protein
MASCRNDGHPEEFNRLLEDWLTNTLIRTLLEMDNTP